MEIFKLFGRIAVEGAQEAENEIDDTRDAAKKLSSGLNDVDDKSKKLSSGGFSILKGAAADLLSSGFQKIISSMGQFVSDGVEYQKALEQYATSFEVMTGSGEKAAEITERLGEVAANTPFEMPTLADTTQLLMNYGFTADDALDKMLMLGDISQGSADKMSRIATAYGQMSSAGKVSLEDVKQMIEAGFNPLQEISQSTGESMESLYDRISKGTISVDEITASMQRSTEEGGKYYGSMDAQSQTLDGRLSTLKDTAMGVFGDAFGSVLQTAADVWIPKFTDMVGKAGEKISQFTEWCSENKDLLTVLGIAVGTLTVAITAYNFAQNATAIATAISTAATTAFGTAMAFVTSPITIVIAIIGALIAVGVLLYKNWDKVKEVAIKVFEKVKSVFEDLGEALSNVWNGIWSTIKSVINWILGGIEKMVNGVIRGINKLLGGIDKVVSGVGGLLGLEWSVPTLNEISLPRLAKGGVLERGQVGLLEGTGAEAVVPLENNRAWISRVADDMEDTIGSGSGEKLQRIIDLLQMLIDMLPDSFKDALDGTALKVNNREFARMVKAVN